MVNPGGALREIDLPDPELSYDADNLDFELNDNESESSTIIISNTGEIDSELNYTINSSPFEIEGDGPDEGGYYWTDSNMDDNTNYDWIDISNIGTIYSFPNNDQAGEWLPLEFNFPFYNDLNNNSYDQLFINN